MPLEKFEHINYNVYPAQKRKLNDERTQLAIGVQDDSLKFLHFLIQQGFMDLPEKMEWHGKSLDKAQIYKELANSYFRMNGNSIDGKVLDQSDFQFFDAVMQKCTWDPDAENSSLIIMNGNTDYFSLRLLQEMNKHNVGFESILSPNSLTFMSAYETDNWEKPLNASTQHMIAAKSNGWISQEEFDALLGNYQSTLRLVSYDLDKSKTPPDFILYTNGFIGLETIKALTTEGNENDQEGLIKAIGNINEKFLRAKKEKKLHLYQEIINPYIKKDEVKRKEKDKNEAYYNPLVTAPANPDLIKPESNLIDLKTNKNSLSFHPLAFIRTLFHGNVFTTTKEIHSPKEEARSDSSIVHKGLAEDSKIRRTEEANTTLEPANLNVETKKYRLVVVFAQKIPGQAIDLSDNPHAINITPTKEASAKGTMFAYSPQELSPLTKTNILAPAMTSNRNDIPKPEKTMPITKEPLIQKDNPVTYRNSAELAMKTKLVELQNLLEKSSTDERKRAKNKHLIAALTQITTDLDPKGNKKNDLIHQTEEGKLSIAALKARIEYLNNIVPQIRQNPNIAAKNIKNIANEIAEAIAPLQKATQAMLDLELKIAKQSTPETGSDKIGKQEEDSAPETTTPDTSSRMPKNIDEEITQKALELRKISADLFLKIQTPDESTIEFKNLQANTNKVTTFIEGEVTPNKKNKEETKYKINYYVALIKKSLELNDFYTAQTIYAGLMSGLKYALTDPNDPNYKLVSTEAREILNQINNRNFNLMRAEQLYQTQMQSKTPIVPIPYSFSSALVNVQQQKGLSSTNLQGAEGEQQKILAEQKRQTTLKKIIDNWTELKNKWPKSDFENPPTIDKILIPVKKTKEKPIKNTQIDFDEGITTYIASKSPSSSPATSFRATPTTSFKSGTTPEMTTNANKTTTTATSTAGPNIGTTTSGTMEGPEMTSTTTASMSSAESKTAAAQKDATPKKSTKKYDEITQAAMELKKSSASLFLSLPLPDVQKLLALKEKLNSLETKINDRKTFIEATNPQVNVDDITKELAKLNEELKKVQEEIKQAFTVSYQENSGAKTATIINSKEFVKIGTAADSLIKNISEDLREGSKKEVRKKAQYYALLLEKSIELNDFQTAQSIYVALKSMNALDSNISTFLDTITNNINFFKPTFLIKTQMQAKDALIPSAMTFSMILDKHNENKLYGEIVDTLIDWSSLQQKVRQLNLEAPSSGPSVLRPKKLKKLPQLNEQLKLDPGIQTYLDSAKKQTIGKVSLPDLKKERDVVELEMKQAISALKKIGEIKLPVKFYFDHSKTQREEKKTEIKGILTHIISRFLTSDDDISNSTFEESKQMGISRGRVSISSLQARLKYLNNIKSETTSQIVSYLKDQTQKLLDLELKIATLEPKPEPSQLEKISSSSEGKMEVEGDEIPTLHPMTTQQPTSVEQQPPAASATPAPAATTTTATPAAPLTPAPVAKTNLDILQEQLHNEAKRIAELDPSLKFLLKPFTDKSGLSLKERCDNFEKIYQIQLKNSSRDIRNDIESKLSTLNTIVKELKKELGKEKAPAPQPSSPVTGDVATIETPVVGRTPLPRPPRPPRIEKADSTVVKIEDVHKNISQYSENLIKKIKLFETQGAISPETSTLLQNSVIVITKECQGSNFNLTEKRDFESLLQNLSNQTSILGIHSELVNKNVLLQSYKTKNAVLNDSFNHIETALIKVGHLTKIVNELYDTEQSHRKFIKDLVNFFYNEKGELRKDSEILTGGRNLTETEKQWLNALLKPYILLANMPDIQRTGNDQNDLNTYLARYFSKKNSIYRQETLKCISHASELNTLINILEPFANRPDLTKTTPKTMLESGIISPVQRGPRIKLFLDEIYKLKERNQLDVPLSPETQKNMEESMKSLSSLQEGLKVTEITSTPRETKKDKREHLLIALRNNQNEGIEKIMSQLNGKINASDFNQKNKESIITILNDLKKYGTSLETHEIDLQKAGIIIDLLNGLTQFDWNKKSIPHINLFLAEKLNDKSINIHEHLESVKKKAGVKSKIIQQLQTLSSALTTVYKVEMEQPLSKPATPPTKTVIDPEPPAAPIPLSATTSAPATKPPVPSRENKPKLIIPAKTAVTLAAAPTLSPDATTSTTPTINKNTGRPLPVPPAKKAVSAPQASAPQVTPPTATSAQATAATTAPTTTTTTTITSTSAPIFVNTPIAPAVPPTTPTTSQSIQENIEMMRATNDLLKTMIDGLRSLEPTLERIEKLKKERKELEQQLALVEEQIKALEQRKGSVATVGMFAHSQPQPLSSQPEHRTNKPEQGHDGGANKNSQKP